MSVLAIVGAQFADPFCFSRLFAHRYGARFTRIQIGDYDGVFVAEDVALCGRSWRVQVLVRACWDEDAVHEAVLATADRVIVALNQNASVEHLNAPAIAAARRHLRPTSRVAVAFNTPLESTAPHAQFAPSEIAGIIPDSWSVHVTRCPYEPGAAVRDDAVASLLAQLLGESTPAS